MSANATGVPFLFLRTDSELALLVRAQRYCTILVTPHEYETRTLFVALSRRISLVSPGGRTRLA